MLKSTYWHVRFVLQLGQIATRWDKSWVFLWAQMKRNLVIKIPILVPLGVNLANCRANLTSVCTCSVRRQNKHTGLPASHLVEHPDTTPHRNASFASKVGLIGPKWDNSGAFSDHPRHQILWNLIWKSPGFVPFGANQTHFGGKPSIPDWSLPLAYICFNDRSANLSHCTTNWH